TSACLPSLALRPVVQAWLPPPFGGVEQPPATSSLPLGSAVAVCMACGAAMQTLVPLPGPTVGQAWSRVNAQNVFAVPQTAPMGSKSSAVATVSPVVTFL